MASKKLQNGTEEWMMFVDFWQMCQEHWIAEDTDEYWDSLIKKSNGFAEKYKDIISGDLSTKLAIAFCEAKDKEMKQKKL